MCGAPTGRGPAWTASDGPLSPPPARGAMPLQLRTPPLRWTHVLTVHAQRLAVAKNSKRFS